MSASEVAVEVLSAAVERREATIERLRNEMAECLHVAQVARHPRAHPYGNGGGTPNACGDCIADANMLVEFVASAASDRPESRSELRWRGVWE